jgi:hypothetical protein
MIAAQSSTVTRNETKKEKLGFHDMDKLKRSKGNKTKRGKDWHWAGLTMFQHESN